MSTAASSHLIAGLAYYYDHQPEMDQEIARQERQVELLRQPVANTC